MIDGGKEAEMGILAELWATPDLRPRLQFPDKRIAIPWSLKPPSSVRLRS
jgi:hypothetical protein